LIQSFERPSLEYLRLRTRVRLVQLTSSPVDVTADRLTAMARYADGIGAEKRLIVPEGSDRRVQAPTHVVRDAHAAGLFVHAWTMRSEPLYLSPSYHGDPAAEVRQFAALGVDGVFSDFPDVAVRASRP
jgi:glycerophosphoryl diester phosphodiesterase